ncbi:uncharacterized protein KY384_006814 [Bacidia gigantensis]|uniref:uncharacterized protein n=1 Tax=Bacidia gigantensis TaxID=2732470 RepID=UPI001D03BD9E|nr:uncharacterized protein KY384_006814 [Bacidia gigantensis]KAG8527898.1 hypothetical protein KY384_006814 [Bacidia gigantensis]
MLVSQWGHAVRQAKNHIYVSLSRDPIFNLAVEHFLFQETPADSRVLLLYVNRPCVVIGKNQNPWLQADLAALRRNRVDIVRRRSGGGAVFHDTGNVNYSVKCSSSEFTRDKHAVMVTEALREFTDRARVNERHDIVLDQGLPIPNIELDQEGPLGMLKTRYSTTDPRRPSLKVSGSAFKISQGKSLHHGTCLLASENIGSISQYLRSPARPFFRAYGSESLPSPVTNILDDELDSDKVSQSIERFKLSVIRRFAQLYGIDPKISSLFENDDASKDQFLRGEDWIAGYVSEVAKTPEIEQGMEELKSDQWRYGTTPRFILSSHPKLINDRQTAPTLPSWFPSDAHVHVRVKQGFIMEVDLSLPPDKGKAAQQLSELASNVNGRFVERIASFSSLLRGTPPQDEANAVVKWLDLMLGKKISK